MTMKMVTILLPLVDLMDEHFPASRAKSLRGLYQDLHYIVSEAGFFSLTLRRSRNIFRFTWPYPGQPWDLDQENYDNTVYQLSLRRTRKLDEKDGIRWGPGTGERTRQRDRIDFSEEDENSSANDEDGDIATLPEDLNTPLGTRLSSRSTAKASEIFIRLGIWRRSTTLNAKKSTAEPAPTKKYPPSRMAKVQICLWPMLQRFATTKPWWERPDTYHTDGEFITSVFRSQVVYVCADPSSVLPPLSFFPCESRHSLPSPRGKEMSHNCEYELTCTTVPRPH